MANDHNNRLTMKNGMRFGLNENIPTIAEVNQSEMAITLLRDFTFMTFQALLDVVGPIPNEGAEPEIFQEPRRGGRLEHAKKTERAIEPSRGFPNG